VNKSLTKEEREVMADFLKSSDDAGLSPDGHVMQEIYAEQLQRALESEAYWCEAMQRAETYGVESSYCSLCHTANWEEKPHAADCPKGIAGSITETS
jgi:hypothetical protein